MHCMLHDLVFHVLQESRIMLEAAAVYNAVGATSAVAFKAPEPEANSGQVSLPLCLYDTAR